MKIIQKKHSLINTLLYLIVIELVMCGSGQVLALAGGFTVRMALFSFAIIVTIPMLKYGRFDKESIFVFGLYIITLAMSSSLSFINSGTPLLLEELKPRIFILLFPFLYWTINSANKIEVVSSIIRNSTLIMAVLYLCYLLLIKSLGLIDFALLYESMTEESDFMFRGEEGELFYKGFVFLPIGLIFWLNKKNWIPVIIISLAIVFTLTRSFYVIGLLGIILYYLLYPKFNQIKLLKVLCATLSLIVFLYQLDIYKYIGDRADSDLTRIITFQQVFEHINFVSLWIGHGLGNGVPIRPLHMESSYLEIFHKQGILTLIYWIYLLSLVIRDYLSNYHNSFSIIYLISVVLIYVQSLFNPYITNPIGLSMIFIGYIIVHYYAKQSKNSSCNCGL